MAPENPAPILMPLPADVETPVAVPMGRDQFFYGGQAVIEGVMMRGKRHYAVAVRLPKTNEIVVDRGELKAAIYVNPMWKLPILRGLALIGEQLHLGMKTLMWSANMNAGGNEVVIGKKEITGSIAFAAIFGLGLFFGLPLLLAGLAVHRSGSFLFVLVEGVIRVGLVLAYLSAIALLPDVRPAFQYHGAAPTTINALESGRPREVPPVRRPAQRDPVPDRDVNEAQMPWIGRTSWRYAMRLTEPPPAPGERVELVFEGLDTVCEVRLDGRLLG